jgi:hypothetical protein
VWGKGTKNNFAKRVIVGEHCDLAFLAWYKLKLLLIKVLVNIECRQSKPEIGAPSSVALNKLRKRNNALGHISFRIGDARQLREAIFRFYKNIWFEESNVSICQSLAGDFFEVVLSPRCRERGARGNDWIEHSTPEACAGANDLA